MANSSRQPAARSAALLLFFGAFSAGGELHVQVYEQRHLEFDLFRCTITLGVWVKLDANWRGFKA